MATAITLRAGEAAVRAELNDTPSAKAIADRLPIEAAANTWGEEVYFDVGVSCALDDDARAEVAVGELGYWPAGRALCVFFGRTPASGPDGKPRAASAVNVIGRTLDDATALKAVRDGQTVHVQRR
jgi:hypothetical protein